MNQDYMTIHMVGCLNFDYFFMCIIYHESL